LLKPNPLAGVLLHTGKGIENLAVNLETAEKMGEGL